MHLLQIDEIIHEEDEGRISSLHVTTFNTLHVQSGGVWQVCQAMGSIGRTAIVLVGWQLTGSQLMQKGPSVPGARINPVLGQTQHMLRNL